MTRLRAAVVVMMVLIVLRATCRESQCPTGYRPFDCTTCVHFTTNELLYSSAKTSCPQLGVLLQEDSVPRETLTRYMEVYKLERVWTGYSYSVSGGVTVPDSNEPLDVTVVGNETCHQNCCIAWQLDPFGVVITDCDKLLPSVCTSNSYSGSIIDSSGFGDTDKTVLVSIANVTQQSTNRHDVTFGAPITLNCSSDGVKWYINNELVNEPNSILKVNFGQQGIYTCQIDSSGGSENISVVLCGIDGEPGNIEYVDVYSYSQSSINITWRPPNSLGTIDPLLLRYTVSYTAAGETNEVKVTPNDYSDELAIQLNDLKYGTKYTISVIAINNLTSSPILSSISYDVTTYGKAPINSVVGLTLEYSGEKSIMASWEGAELSPPEGPVAGYLVEYRNGPGQESPSARVPSDQTFLTFNGIENGDKFQVRVAILVVVNVDTHNERSTWTDWVGLPNSTSAPTNKGPIRPTDSKADESDIVIAAILVPLAIVVVLVLLVAYSLFVCFQRRRSRRYEMSKGVEFSTD